MIKNKGCCDLVHAKRLRDLGVKVETTWEYSQMGHLWPRGGFLKFHAGASEEQIEDLCPAPTCAELGAMLGIHLGEFRPQYAEETEADYRASMLIHLITQGHLKVGDLL